MNIDCGFKLEIFSKISTRFSVKTFIVLVKPKQMREREFYCPFHARVNWISRHLITSFINRIFLHFCHCISASDTEYAEDQQKTVKYHLKLLKCVVHSLAYSFRLFIVSLEIFSPEIFVIIFVYLFFIFWYEIGKMTSKATSRREEFHSSSSNVVRTLHPSRPISPPQKHVEYNNNNLGNLYIQTLASNIKSLFY